MNRAEALREIERKRQASKDGLSATYIGELEAWLVDLLTEPKVEPTRCAECDELATHCAYCGYVEVRDEE